MEVQIKDEQKNTSKKQQYSVSHVFCTQKIKEPHTHLLSFTPPHLTPSSLSQLFCLLRWCRIKTCHVRYCMCVSGSIYAPLAESVALATFFLLPLLELFHCWTGCLDVLCNRADLRGTEVPCVKSTSSKTTPDLTLQFSVVLLFVSRWSSLIDCISTNTGLAYCHSCSCQETELISFSCCCLAVKRAICSLYIL